MASAEAPKPLCKVHVKDICFTRIYIGGHFDAPFESYRLDQAVQDLVSGTGVSREQLMPLACFLFKGYLWTINNRRLWALRHALMFSGRGEEIDVMILPESAMPERKDYVARLPFAKQQALVHPSFLPIIHGDQPLLQKHLLKPIFFRFDSVFRNGYRVLPGGRVLCVNAHEAAAMFQATGVKLPGTQGVVERQGTLLSSSTHGAEDEEDKGSVKSVDFPGRQGDWASKPYAASWSAEKSKALLGMPSLKEEKEEKEEETEGERGKGGKVELSEEKKKELQEVALKFKAAVAGLRLVLDNLDAAFEKLAA